MGCTVRRQTTLLVTIRVKRTAARNVTRDGTGRLVLRTVFLMMTILEVTTIAVRAGTGYVDSSGTDCRCVKPTVKPTMTIIMDTTRVMLLMGANNACRDGMIVIALPSARRERMTSEGTTGVLVMVVRCVCPRGLVPTAPISVCPKTVILWVSRVLSAYISINKF